jgi:hypothetical protein
MQFSLEVINKSMLAVDLIRKYKEEGGRAGSRHPSKQEIEDVEKIIIQCQESMQKNLIPEDDPKLRIRNQLSLKKLKYGSTLTSVAAQAEEKVMATNQ